ncbi:hypothetical protein CYMTET_3043 [Cymbomonas tetramitiformis]|uniref:Secreted protein n=1 Tax=Cymbomonas tetramitiformis TaxID=36881 RepID=A0AAE0LLE8_9CHLO|nr:hypothetical protein CYMTET_3043 [Cymbomonas tetramitiformis]
MHGMVVGLVVMVVMMVGLKAACTGTVVDGAAGCEGEQREGLEWWVDSEMGKRPGIGVALLVSAPLYDGCHAGGDRAAKADDGQQGGG